MKITTQKLKLLLVSDTYYPQVDGTVRFIEEFMKRAGEFEVTLLVPQFQKHLKGKNIISLSVSRWIKPLPTYPAIQFSWKNWAAIKKAVQEHDLVFAQGPAWASLLSIYYARKYKKPCFTYLHVLSWELFEQSSTLPGKKAAAYLLKQLCLSVYNRSTVLFLPYRELQEQLPEIRTKVEVARLGIDIDKFYPSQNKAESKQKVGLDNSKKVIVYVGRISKEKNIRLLVKAFVKLPHQEHLQLVLVGSGSEQELQQYRILKNCLITGFVRNVEDYLRAAEVFVMPSLTETTSLATLEAMSCGLPVLATKVGFIQNYVVKGHNGLFIPKYNPALLAAKMEKVLNDKALRERLGANARKTVAYSFSWERSINKIKRILREEYYQAYTS